MLLDGDWDGILWLVYTIVHTLVQSFKDMHSSVILATCVVVCCAYVLYSLISRTLLQRDAGRRVFFCVFLCNACNCVGQ